MNKQEVMSMMDNKIDSESLSLKVNSTGENSTGEVNSIYDNPANKNLSCWDYWQERYYPQIIRESYPIYIGERAKDNGKQAFEIIKALMDKKLLKLDTVRDFIEAMDLLINTL